MSSETSQYIRHVLHHTPTPPAIEARFFYTSPVPIDDPLSPLPPSTTGNVSAKQPPKAFSQYDNTALDRTWHDLRGRILKYNEEHGEKGHSNEASRSRQSASNLSRVDGPSTELEMPSDGSGVQTLGPEVSSLPDTTGTPFIRAPSRKKMPTLHQDERPTRPKIQTHDTYDWDDATHLVDRSPAPDDVTEAKANQSKSPSTRVAVGVSRLHQVEMPDLKMTPIYWTPVGDIAEVVRGTWFYHDTMLPVETSVANMLEAGYIDLQVWTETWKDELNSAVEVGAVGEMKIVHKLWPERLPKASDSRPSSRRGPATRADREDLLRQATSNLVQEAEAETTPGQIREKAVEAAGAVIDISTGSGGVDNKATGATIYGRQGTVRTYGSYGVIYANEREARILKPSLLPSSYFGRRPVANYIREGYKLGIQVVRGFDQATWDKLHPPKLGPEAIKAKQGTATSSSGAPPNTRRKNDPDLMRAERPKVTDLIFVIHGIGQQYSKRMESFHFTHAMNAFRRDINVEVGSNEVKARFRKDMGGIMVLPINWRHTLSFEEGGYLDGSEHSRANDFSLAEITPETLPSVRHIINDVFSDIPFYLSHHQPKMIAAVVREANRVYQLWCKNNPDFAGHGRVHLIAHSLGSVMAVDVLSRQPTTVPMHLLDPTRVDLEAEQLDHFLFDTSNLYLGGSPAGFFLLLKRSQLLPRIGHPSVAAMDDSAFNSSSVCGERGQYGCIPVDNVYNIINPYDPVAYRINAAVDANYAASISKATIPSATPGWFGVGTKSSAMFGGSTTKNVSQMPTLPRLPSNVEMETHNFSREEIAEKRMLLLNDNGQIDYFLRYGGGTFEIQYITMLSAHSSYWLLKDFVRMIVTETGREKGREGTFLGMRAVKKKGKVP